MDDTFQSPPQCWTAARITPTSPHSRTGLLGHFISWPTNSSPDQSLLPPYQKEPWTGCPVTWGQQPEASFDTNVCSLVIIK